MNQQPKTVQTIVLIAILALVLVVISSSLLTQNSGRLAYSDVLDLFAGTGSISYEFASRGARGVTAVEINPVHYNFIRQTAAQLGIGSLHAVKANAFLYLKNCNKQFDIVFSDAPYDLEGSEEIVRLTLEGDRLRSGGLLIFEHSKKADFSDNACFWQLRSYGSVQFSFFKKP